MVMSANINHQFPVFKSIQLIGTKVRPPKMRHISSLCRLSLQAETIAVCTVSQCFPHGNTACNHSCCECRKSKEPSVCHKNSRPFCDLLKPVSSQTMECPVTRAQIKAFSGRRDSKLLTMLSPFPAPLPLVIVDAWCGDLAQLLDVFVSEVRSIIRRIASHVLPYHRTRRYFLAVLLPTKTTSQWILRRFHDPNRFLRSSKRFFVRLTNTFSASQVNLIPDLRRFLQVNLLHPSLPRGVADCVSFLPF